MSSYKLKLLSASLILAGFAVGAQAQTSADASAAKVERVEATVNKIQTDVEVIRANQTNAAAVDREQTRQLAEQRKDIKVILQLVAEGLRNDDAH